MVGGLPVKFAATNLREEEAVVHRWRWAALLSEQRGEHLDDGRGDLLWLELARIIAIEETELGVVWQSQAWGVERGASGVRRQAWGVRR